MTSLVIEPATARESSYPGVGCTSSPFVIVRSNCAASCPDAVLDGEVVEGTFHVTENYGSPSAVEGCLDDRILSRGEPPRTGDTHRSTRSQLHLGKRVVFQLAHWLAQRLSLGVQPAGHILDLGIPQSEQRQIQQMDAQIHDTTTARLLSIVEPGFIRAVGIVEHEVGRINIAETARARQLQELRNTGNGAIAEIHAQQCVAGTGGRDDSGGFRRGPGERLLTENGSTPLEGSR